MFSPTASETPGPRRRSPHDTAVKISVVVISRNEGAELRRTLENLRATLPARSEIVVVDDQSTDGSTARLRGVIKAPGIGVARARNLGASKTSGDLLFFADAHIRLDKNWWRPLAEVLEDPKVAAVAPAVTHLPATRGRGYGLTLTGADLDARWLPGKGTTPFAAPILPGCSLLMRRDTVDAVGVDGIAACCIAAAWTTKCPCGSGCWDTIS